MRPGSGSISTPLLRWYRKRQRDLPWRRNPTPYAIWVSEIMLQQTQVATVVPYFERWMDRFPTLEALAAAQEDDVLHAWQGLGYYSRARNLLRGARAVMAEHGGRVPDTPEALRALPGVGPYTAGAIASIAYNVPAPIVDGNVERVLARVFALRGDPKKAPLKGELWRLAEELIPEGEARDFNPALMELGATVCVPVRPRCAECPVSAACAARRLNLQDALPETAKGPEITPVRMAAAVVREGDGPDGRLLLVQRRADERRWAGMWQFPAVEAGPAESGGEAAARAVREAVGLEVAPGPRAALVRHSVTRYRIALEALHCRLLGGEARALGSADWRWLRPEETEAYALPAAHRRILHALQGAGEAQLELGLS